MARIAAVAILLVAITVVLYSLPEKSSEWIRSREMIRKLYLFPILLSAMWFGARGAASSTVFATLVCGGLAGNDWPAEVSSQVERVGEVAVFWLVGALSASFFEQQKRFVGKIEVANDNTLLALAAALDVREHNTGVHSQRVADYTLRLAREVGVRDKDTLDVYDALTTDRAYHTARSHTDALIKIREESETHFDPEVVAAFAKISFEDLREIAKKNQTPLLFASPPVPSLHQVASVLSPQS